MEFDKPSTSKSKDGIQPTLDLKNEAGRGILKCSSTGNAIIANVPIRLELWHFQQQ